ncbi:MAG: carboxypeptidase regulatory-like domain-containing protein, partial [Gammaproteobacteria bacterium]|nr:carboxypeptidase regulatory-like domain-containing protein [Gammaproteobacteria bacterium]
MQNRAIPPRRLGGIRALTVLVGVLLGAGHAVAQAPGAGEGVIEGRVIAAESGKPAGDAFVSVPGLDASAVTAADGSFRLVVPAGTHDIVIEKSGFGAEEVRDVAVVAGQTVNTSA